MRAWAGSVIALALASALLPAGARAAGLNLAVEVLSSSSTSTTTTPPIIPPSGGGGGGSGSTNTQTGVTVSGRAYPLSRVTVLKDGAVAATTIAGPDARFSVTLTRISGGTHTISVRAEDAVGRESALFSFPLRVTEGAMTTVSGIFLSPTIDLDKQQVKQGDPLAIFGRTAPDAQVNITVHSEEVISRQVVADRDGTYLYYLNTAPLSMGDHTAEALSGTNANAILSAVSPKVGFVVGTENIARDTQVPTDCRKADINCNGRVDLVDYSILVYWYQRAGELPPRVDLNGDRVITLVDLSILAYYWTG